MNAASLYQDLVRTTASTAVGFVHSEVARGDTHSTLRNKLAGDCWGLLGIAGPSDKYQINPSGSSSE